MSIERAGSVGTSPNKPRAAVDSPWVAVRWLGAGPGWCLIAWIASGCSPLSGGPVVAPPPSSRVGEEAEPPARTVAALLAQPPAAALPEPPLAAGESPCLLYDYHGHLQLAAPLAPATQALPALNDDLSALLTSSPGPARALTRFGRLGEHMGTGPVLVSLSEVPQDLRQRRASAGFLTAGGALYLRPVATTTGDGPPASESAAATAPFSRAALAAAGLATAGANLLFLAIESHTSEGLLRGLLQQLPESVQVILSTALPGSTRLPEDPVLAPPSEACPSWPLPLAQATAGDLDPKYLRSALGALTRSAQQCMSSSQGATEGRLVLGLRIDETGAVAHACLLGDEWTDPAVSACLLKAARQLYVSPPDPSGVVDVELPLRLLPAAQPPHRNLCAARARAGVAPSPATRRP